MKSPLTVRKTKPSLFPAILAGMLLCAVGTTCASPEYKISQFFLSLQQDFNSILSEKEARSNNLAQLDKYFNKVLKEHPAFVSLARTNARGVVIQEVSKTEEDSWKHKNILEYAAFKQVIKNNRAYQYAKKTESGAWFLIWSNAVFIPKLGSAATFGGVLIAKFDLKKCIQNLAGSIQQPFEMLMSDTILYSHNWTEPEGFTEMPLTIPGAEQKAMVRYLPSQSPPTPAAAGQTGTEQAQQPISPGAQGIAAPAIEQKTHKPGSKSISSAFIVGIIVAVALFAALGFFLSRQSRREKDSIL